MTAEDGGECCPTCGCPDRCAEGAYEAMVGVCNRLAMAGDDLAAGVRYLLDITETGSPLGSGVVINARRSAIERLARWQALRLKKAPDQSGRQEGAS